MLSYHDIIKDNDSGALSICVRLHRVTNMNLIKDLFKSSHGMKTRLISVAKIIVGFILAIVIAELLHIDYAYTAGVIAILGLDSTRKRSIQSAIFWLLDSLLAIGLASLLFFLLGYHFWVLIIFIALLIPISYFLKINGGIVIAVVLISQIYFEQDLLFAFNAMYVLFVGIGVAFLLNLYMPSVDKEIENAKMTITREMEGLIALMAAQQPIETARARQTIKEAQKKLYRDIENHFSAQPVKRQAYFQMRLQQIYILERVSPILQSIEPMPEKSKIIELLQSFAAKMGTGAYAESLRETLHELLTYFREAALPKTRIEFEKRARLYHVLVELDDFLLLKIRYHEQF